MKIVDFNKKLIAKDSPFEAEFLMEIQNPYYPFVVKLTKKTDDGFLSYIEQYNKFGRCTDENNSPCLFNNEDVKFQYTILDVLDEKEDLLQLFNSLAAAELYAKENKFDKPPRIAAIKYVDSLPVETTMI